jgi:hypothetical protein
MLQVYEVKGMHKQFAQIYQGVEWMMKWIFWDRVEEVIPIKRH